MHATATAVQPRIPANQPGWIRSFLFAEADDWRVSPRTLVVIMLIPVIILATGVVAAWLGKSAYKQLVEEDGIAENLQVLLYATALPLSIVMSRRLWTSGSRGLATLYLFLAFGFFFMVGEELSWGQRMFGWATPQQFGAVNKQQETNLHNIYGVGATFKWLQMVAGGYGLFLPLLLLRRTVPRKLRNLASLLLPPFSLVPYFATMFTWRLFRNLAEVPHRYYFAVEEYNEVVELVFAAGMLLFLLFQLRRMQNEEQPSHQP
jgi:hypothetical protein